MRRWCLLLALLLLATACDAGPDGTTTETEPTPAQWRIGGGDDDFAKITPAGSP